MIPAPRGVNPSSEGGVRRRYRRGNHISASPVANRGRPSAERRLGIRLKVLSINAEGLTEAKGEYLGMLLKKHDVDVCLVQETHLTSSSSPLKAEIPGYAIVERVDSRAHGVAVYARDPGAVTLIGSGSDKAGVQRISIKTRGIYVHNVYKPPKVKWSGPPVHGRVAHPSILLGDYNSHHPAWGYKVPDPAGKALQDWVDDNELVLIYDPTGRGTYSRPNCPEQYTPDLTLVTRDAQGNQLAVTREILDDFPRSRHRPTLVTTGSVLASEQRLLLPRWNFRRADWEGYSAYVEENVRSIPSNSESVTRFSRLLVASAKRFIPRGARKYYTPCWTEESERLYPDTRDPAISL